MNQSKAVSEAVAGSDRPFYDDRLTPYIDIDAQRLERNLQRMQQLAAAGGVQLRPHVKTHKSVAIAQRQIELGAVGITVSKPSEGVVFIKGGVRDVLLAYPVVRAETVSELFSVAASTGSKLGVIVAGVAGVAAIAKAAAAVTSLELSVWIKVDVGLGRVGINPESDDALLLASALKAEGLHFAGLLSHAGHAYGAQNPEQMADIVQAEAHCLQGLRQRLQDAGFVGVALSVGATPSILGASLPAGYHEIRPGNYALLDLTGLRLQLCSLDDVAISVVARVVSVNDRYAIIDAGSKALSSDKGPHGTSAADFGLAVNELTDRHYRVEKLSEEHGFIPHGGNKPAIGSLMRIFPNHSCAVMAQFTHFVMRKPDGTADIITIDARGQFL
ncbi:alanine racemase [Erwinia sp.]|uniref:alanine racemase n=1 Tax=Erwinia citreus TaxID=558 RepID=UPI003C793A06